MARVIPHLASTKEDGRFVPGVSTHPARPCSEQANAVMFAMALAIKAVDERLVFTFSLEGTTTNATRPRYSRRPDSGHIGLTVERRVL